MLANMTHVFPAKKYIYSYVFSTGLRCAMLASMIHVGEHDSCWRAWLTSSTALLYQILRWNLSRNFSWVRKKSLFKLGFQVPLSNGRIFMCYNATETRVREITRHRVKQIILLSIIHQVYWVILAVAWERRKFPPLSRPSPSQAGQILNPPSLHPPCSKYGPANTLAGSFTWRESTA